MAWSLIRFAAPIISVLLLTPPTQGQTKPAENGNSDQDTKPVQQPRVALSIRLAKPISAEEIERYCELLGLADPQRVFLQHLHRAYIDKRVEIERREMPQLQFLAEEGAATFVTTGRYSADTAIRFEAFMRKQDQIEREFVRSEESLFAELESVLAESQVQNLQRVRWHRQRASSWIPARAIFASRIDLSRILEEKDLLHQPTSALDQVLFEYEAAITPLFVSLDHAVRKSSVKFEYIKVEREFRSNGERIAEGSPESLERNRIASERRESAFAGVVSLERQISQANQSYLQRIIEQLPLLERDWLAGEYREWAELLVFPDRFDPTRHSAEIRNDPSLTSDQQQAVEAEWDKFRQSYETICKKMCAISDRCQEDRAREDYSQCGELDSDLKRLGEARKALTREFWTTLKSLLPDRLAARATEWVNEFGPPSGGS